MRARYLLTLGLIVMVMLPAAAAAEPEATRIRGVQTWTEPHAFEGPVIIERGSIITVEGSSIILHNGSLLVEAGALLELKSTRDAPAEIVSGTRGGWKGRILGGLSVIGLPEHPVLLDGIGGFSGVATQGDIGVTFQQGFTVAAGALTARHLVVQNYTTGIYVGGQSTADLANVAFASENGIGFLASDSTLHLENATFVGPGATMFITVGRGETHVRNATFERSGTALTIRETNATIENVRLRDVVACIRVAGGGNMHATLTKIDCDGFQEAGLVALGSSRGTSRGVGSLDVRDSTFRSEKRGATAAISLVETLVDLRDVKIGPVEGTGIAAEGYLPTAERVQFSGINGTNVYLIGPREEQALAPLGDGPPGRDGYMIVADHSLVYVTDPYGQPAHGASVRVFRDDIVIHEERTGQTGRTNRLLFEIARLDAEGKTQHSTYRVRAVAQDGGAEAESTTLGDAAVVTLRLKDATPAATPGVPAALWILASAGLATALRSRKP